MSGPKTRVFAILHLCPNPIRPASQPQPAARSPQPTTRLPLFFKPAHKFENTFFAPYPPSITHAAYRPTTPRHLLAKHRITSIFILPFNARFDLPRSPSPSPQPTAHSPSQQPVAPLFPPPFWGPFSAHFYVQMRSLLEILTLLGTFLGKMLYIVHFQRRNAFSPTGHLFFGYFWAIFQIRNAIFVDFEERHTASVDVWVIFGSFSKGNAMI